MTGKERNILDRISDDIRRLDEKVDVLTGFMQTYTEKSKHCDAQFKALEAMALWSRKTLLRWSGGLAVVMFLLGIAAKALKVI
jgi:hypothetical protein